MGRKVSEISIIPFSKYDDVMGGLLPSEAQFYSND